MKDKSLDILGGLAVIILIIYNLPVIVIFGLVVFLGWLSSLPFRERKKRQFKEEVLEFVAKEKIVGLIEFDRNFTLSDEIESKILPRFGKKLLIDVVDGNKYEIPEKYTKIARKMNEYSESNDDNWAEDECDSEFYTVRLLTVGKSGKVTELRAPINENGRVINSKAISMLDKALENALKEWGV